MQHVAMAMTRLSAGLAGLSVAGLLGLAMLTTADVSLRFLFGSPIRGLTDITALTAALLLSGCLPYVVTSQANITVRLVGRSLGPIAFRALEVFGALVIALAFAVMAWQGTAFALDTLQSGDVMPTLRWAVWPWWFGVALMLWVTAVTAIVIVLPTANRGRAPDDPGVEA